MLRFPTPARLYARTIVPKAIGPRGQLRCGRVCLRKATRSPVNVRRIDFVNDSVVSKGKPRTYLRRFQKRYHGTDRTVARCSRGPRRVAQDMTSHGGNDVEQESGLFMGGLALGTSVSHRFRRRRARGRKHSTGSDVPQ